MEKIERYLLWSIWGGIFLLLFMPFVIVNSMYFPFVAGKGFYFRIIVEILVMLYVALVAFFPKWRPQKNILYWVFGSLLGFLFISNIFSPNSYKSFFSNYERMEGYINIVHLVLFFVVVHSTVFKQKMWNLILASSLGISVIVTGYVLLQLAGGIEINQGGVRVDGPFGNAAYLAMYALIHIFIALYFAFKEKRAMFLRVLAVLVLLGNLFVLYHTQTRGAILGLIGGMFLTAAIVAFLKRDNPKIKKASIGALIGIVAFVGLFVLLKDTSFIRNSPTLARFASISLEERTTVSRFKIWGMAIEGIKEKPIFGWGQESFNYVFNTYYDPSLYNQEQWFDRTHNLFFDWLIAGGILGGGSYLTLFVIAIYLIWRREDLEDLEKAALIGLVSSYFFQNLFVFDNPTSYMIFFLLLAFFARGEEREEEDALNLHEKNIRLVTGGTLIVVIVFASYVFSVKPLVAGGKLISSLQSYSNFVTHGSMVQTLGTSPGGAELTRSQIPGVLENPSVSPQIKDLLAGVQFGDPNEKLIDIFSQTARKDAENVKIYFEDTINLNTFATNEAREQIASVATRIAGNEQFPVDLKGEFGLFAREQLLAHAATAPEDARFQLLVGTTMRQLGDIAAATKYMNKAHELSPKKQTILIELGTVHLQAGENEKALAVWREAHELAPEFREAKLAYGAGLVLNGQSEEGEEVLEEIKTNSPSGESAVNQSGLLMHVYTRAKDYEGLRDIWLWRVENNPDNINNRISLSATYYELGERSKAIATLEEAINIDPNFEQLGSQYIEDIKAGRKPQ